jgi:CSLREA domain-containing protein
MLTLLRSRLREAPVPNRSVAWMLVAGLGTFGFLSSSEAVGQSVIVNDAGDTVHACAVSGTGACSLRDAILYANATPGTLIQFNIPGSGVHTISPATALPAVTNPTMINGYTQPGSATNAGPPGTGRTYAVILIELDGSVENGSTAGVGLTISGGGSQVSGLVVGGWVTAGILLETNGNNWVWGNFIGTNLAGTAAHPNGVGIRVMDAAGNLIGGPGYYFSRGAQYVNLISGNTTGVDVQAPGTTVQQNVVGLNAPLGNQAIPNGLGISISAADATLGRNLNGPISPNTISGNLTSGIRIQGAGATGCKLVDNVIGGGGLGVPSPIGNGGAGILVSGATGVTLSGNTVVGNGGAGIDASNSSGLAIGDALSENRISNNGGAGIVLQGAGHGNTIRQNSILGNAGLGIDLGNDAVTVNDACDSDSGPNDLQNLPVLTSATSVGGSTTIQGTLNSAASTVYRIEFFSNDACDSSGFGEGKTFLGSTMATTDISCNASFNATFPVVVRGIITATATDLLGSTSEFSACIPLAQQFHTTTPCRLIDTRGPAGAYGAPALAAGEDRTFVIGGKCGVPSTAQAVVFNFTVTQPTNLGDLRVFAAGSTLPLVSTVNWRAGQTRANNAVVTLGPNGDIVVHVDQTTGTVDFIADVSGYFE